MLFALNCFIKQKDNGTTNRRKLCPEGKIFDRIDNVKPVSAEEIARIKKSASKFVFVLD
jgi:hypothetical protein